MAAARPWEARRWRRARARRKPGAGQVRFGVRTPLPDGLTLRERAQLVKRLGYDGIELGDEWLDQPVEAIQEQLAGIGIAVSAIVGSIRLLDTDPLVRAAGCGARPPAPGDGARPGGERHH